MPDNDAALRFAYRKGRAARLDGKHLKADPYLPHSPYSAMWQKGWQEEAEREAPAALQQRTG